MPFTRHTRARCNSRYLSLSFSLESRIEERERSGDERAGGSAERRWRRRRASASECERASEEVQVGGAAERERERGERAEGRQAGSGVCRVVCRVSVVGVGRVGRRDRAERASELEASERARAVVAGGGGDDWWCVVSCVVDGRRTVVRSVGRVGSVSAAVGAVSRECVGRKEEGRGRGKECDRDLQ